MRTVPIVDCPSIWRRLARSALVIAIATTLATTARAGSIFDDNWTPPKSVERSKPPAPTPAPATPTTAPTNPAESPQPKPAPPISNQPTVVAPAPVETTIPLVPAPPARRSIPAKADLTRSRTLLREAYADLLKDKSFKARKALVGTLLEESDKSANNPSDQFALLTGAIEAAKEGESLRLCIAAADKLADLFEVDGLKVKTQAATSMVLKTPTPAETLENVRADLELADELVAAEDFAGAARVIALARPLATDIELRGQVIKRSQSIEAARTAFEQTQALLDRVKASPNDGTANLAIGAHYCFKLGQWDKGLAYLAKGSDAKYSELAKSELAATASAAEALTLAAGWWDRAEEKGTTDAEARAIKLHAATWYRFGQSAATGLAAKVTEVRLGQAASLGFAGGNSPSIPSAMLRPTGPAGAPRTLDLLRLIDVKKDVIEGSWSMTADGLKVEVSDSLGRGKLRIPYAPPSEYDLNVEFTRLQQGPHPPLLFQCIVNGRNYYVGFGVENNHEIRIWGSSDREALRTRSDAILVDNQRYKVRIEVRTEKISAYLDEKLSAGCVVMPNQGESGREWWAGEHVMGMGTWDTLVVHSMKLTEIGHGGTLMALTPTGELPPLPLPAPADVPKRVINLMPLIDPQRDSNEGVWEKVSGGIASTGGKCRLRIPYQPPDEYDFRIAFRRIEGDGGMGQVMSVRGKSVIWYMADNWNSTSAFEYLAGHAFGSNSSTVFAPASVRTGRTYVCVVHVRRNRICTSVDGKLVADYKTDGTDLGIADWWWIGDNVLGVCANGSRVQFDAIEIREISGQGKAVEHAEIPSLGKPPPNDPALKTVDLMPLIDPSVDTIGGRWNRVNKTTLASDGSAARLRIPYHPPEEYDFHVRLHRTGGNDCAVLMMSHGLHNFHWIMGCMNNRVCGFELVNGRRVDRNPETVKADSIFQTGRSVDVVAYVRNGSVSVSVDGKLVAEHKTNYADLTALNDTYVGDGALGLGAWTGLSVDVVEIREITGEGRPAPRGQ